MRKTLVRLGSILTPGSGNNCRASPHRILYPDFSTYLGVLKGILFGIAVDHQGNIHVAGVTGSPAFPTPRGVSEDLCWRQWRCLRSEIQPDRSTDLVDVLWRS